MKRKLASATVFALLAVAAQAASQKPAVAFTFVCNGSPSQRIGTCPNGAQPNSLIQGSDGNFYGTAWASSEGTSTASGGTVFSLTSAGKFTLLHSFAPGANGNFANGRGPISLTEGADGNLYGLTIGGGNGPGSNFPDYGVTFRVSRTGTGFKVIHRFCSVGAFCSDGGPSSGPLMAGADGNIYGATSEGGADIHCPCGTIFKVTPSSGTYEVVSNFDLAVGEYPYGLTPAPDGNFYGISNEGGKLFSFAPAGGLQATALTFPFPSGCSGLACFASSVIGFGANGDLYGLYTVYDLGASGLYEVEPDGSNLHLFPLYNTTASGGGPIQLMLGSDGNLWIPANIGGSGNGAIIALSPSTGKVLHSYAPFSTSAAVGVFPSSLIQAKDGTLWGTASDYGVVSKGHFGGGTVYRMNLGLPPR